MSKPVTEDLFSFRHRRNRGSYIWAVLAQLFLFILIWGVAVVLSFHNGRFGPLGGAGVLMIPILVSGWAIGGQRCRDFGWTGWAMLITLIPYIGWIFALAIMFIPGTLGPNRYGPDPLEETVPR